MKKSYFHHVEVGRQQGTPSGTSLHEFGLYGALASRYVVSMETVPEPIVWCELAPFQHLEPEAGLTALAEYVVYKEMPTKADIPWLESIVRRGLSMWNEENRGNLVEMASVSGFSWAHFVE